MSELARPVAIVCAQCGADPRLTASCKACGGAGIGVASPDGFLVWSDPVDDFTIALRAIKKNATVIFHLAIMIGLGVAVAAILWSLTRLDDVSVIREASFWVSGRWDVSLAWFAAFLGCFLIFRLSEYSSDVRSIPGWAMTEAQLEAHDAAAPTRADHRFEIAPHFSEEARDTVERAYGIAHDLKRTEVRPDMLFAAALTGPSGGLFMARLGLSFDLVKRPLATLMISDASAGNPPIAFSKETKRSLALAYAEARTARRKHVSPIELFLQSFKDSPKLQTLLDRLGFPAEHVMKVAEWVRLQEQLREDYLRFVELAALKPKSVMNRAMTAQQTPLLDRFSEDLTIAARNGYLQPLIGREREMEELLRAIESGNRSVALVGESGTGKGAMIEELARRMVEEDVPPELFDRRLVSVNVAQVVSAGESGLAAERLITMLREVGMSGNVILAVHGIESLVGGGSGPMDLAEAFASELDRGYFIAIATTTPAAWTQYIERRSLGTKLVKVNVTPLEAEDTLRVLMA
ncbi:hypothetical protein KKF45_01455, partial [Patescibacteria group bacterium]|nr:hypothetical protein [Patescibacteria group bacterium]